MLSTTEYHRIQHQLNNIPTSFTTKQRNNRKQRLRKQLKEHYYATTYSPFTPSPYIPYYVNSATSTSTLNSLIRAAQTSTIFTIDTESINIYKGGNKPALIQLQIIFSVNSSLVILIEIYHLPSNDNPNFLLIQELFQHVFTPEKHIFIWGTYDELIPFTLSALFTTNQIYGIKYCNLQHDFQLYWQEHHPHRTSNAEDNITTTGECICQSCLGHEYSHVWALQEATARELKEYLPKVLTNERFHIGLDPALHSHGQDEDEYAKALTQYALYDVLAMQRLITQMQNNQFTFTFRPTCFAIEDIVDLSPGRSIDEAEEQIIIRQQPLIIEPKQIIIPQTLLMVEPEQSSTSQTNDNQQQQQQQQQQLHPTSTLTAEQRRKIHNRSCTIKQRRRNYRHELIFYDVYYRFSVRKIKSILRSKHIPISAVNISKSNNLYVGIKPEFKDKLQEYTHITRNFFSRQHYFQIQYDRRRPTTNRQNYRRYS